MFKTWQGFLVPERDAEHVLNRRVAQCANAVNRVSGLGLAGHVMVQAGGNWGYWPVQFTKLFKVIYTFEPDALCFACLTGNTASFTSVVRIQAALGAAPAFVDLWRDLDTTGNQKIQGEGIYPTLRIDDLGLPVCDLIYLDIEGSEPSALRGAMQTIARCKPCVIFEERQTFANSGEAKELMQELGYSHVGDIGADIVMRAA